MSLSVADFAFAPMELPTIPSHPEPIPRLPALDLEQEAKRLREWVAQSGLHVTVQQAARYLIDLATSNHGRRFEVTCRSLGEALRSASGKPMSGATGSRCLKKLRESGLLERSRFHSYVICDDGSILGIPTVHEITTPPDLRL